MLIKSSNRPIEIVFDKSVDFTKIRITLWFDGKELKIWDNDSIEIKDNKITCPLTQEETASFPEGFASLEIKWLDKDRVTFAERVVLTILDRYDIEVLSNE